VSASHILHPTVCTVICRFSQPGAIATEMFTSSAAESGFYVSLMAGYYNENFHVDMPQTFHTTDRRIALTRPLLYAELDYCNTQGLTVCLVCSRLTRSSVLCGVYSGYLHRGP